MQVFIFIPTFFIFFFTLYKLVKDDHVFLRKNVRPEQIFDVAFIVIMVCLFFSQFQFSKNGSTLPFLVLGGSLSLYFIGRYKKLPLGRFYDFFTLSFLTSLPVWFLLMSLFSKKMELILYIINFFVYLILTLIFMNGFLPRIMNRTLKDGKLSIFFLTFFSFFSLVVSVIRVIKERVVFLNAENILLILLFVVSLVLLLKQRKHRLQ